MIDVVLHYDVGPALVERVTALADEGLRVVTCPQGDDERFCAALPAAQVLWHVLEPIAARHIELAPRLALIQKIGVGVNTIDLEAARRAGVAVCNMPGTNSAAVMEMTLALMLAALRRLPQVDRLTRDGGGWSFDPALQDEFGELGARTVGLVGFGATAGLLAPVLEALGARVIYTAPSEKEVHYERVGLDELFAEADIVSLHVPLTDETEQMVDARRLASMKPGAVLVNTARGGLVDETALLEALTEGHLRAAGLDVHAEEPVDETNPLLSLPNVVLAPHLAWLTPETLERSLGVAIENTRRVVAGEPLLHHVT